MRVTKIRYGKKYFFAKGQRFAHLGLIASEVVESCRRLPQWARDCVFHGYLSQRFNGAAK